jgi:hypothetical protein
MNVPRTAVPPTAPLSSSAVEVAYLKTKITRLEREVAGLKKEVTELKDVVRGLSDEKRVVK